MHCLNLILLYDSSMAHILMCKRRKQPYQGLYNLVGGKVEPGEDGLTAAYRELEEETAVTRHDVALIHQMDFCYPLSGIQLEVYTGHCKHSVQVHGDENELYWIPATENFLTWRALRGKVTSAIS